MHASHDYINGFVNGNRTKGQINCVTPRVQGVNRKSKANNYASSSGLKNGTRCNGSLQQRKSEQGFERALRKATEAITGASIQLLKTIGKTLAAAIITSPITYLVVKEAYETRGYFAVGGEWILSIGLVVVVLCMMESKSGVSCGK